MGKGKEMRRTSGFFVRGILALAIVTPAFAQVDTTFDEGALVPAVSLDIPNGGVAAITLDTVNEELDFTTSGDTDMWTSRADAPFAWVSRPSVTFGQTWFVETEVRYDTDVASSKERVA